MVLYPLETKTCNNFVLVMRSKRCRIFVHYASSTSLSVSFIPPPFVVQQYHCLEFYNSLFDFIAAKFSQEIVLTGKSLLASIFLSMWCYLERKKTVSANSLVDMFTNIVEAPVCRQFGDDIVYPVYNPIVVALRGLPTSHLWGMITAPLKHSQI